jgi:transposase
MEGAMTCNQLSHRQPVTRFDHAAVYASLELARSRWLVTVLLPGGETMSQHNVKGGNARALIELLQRQRAKAERRLGSPVKIVMIQEAGLDGFWVHRMLELHGVESHVVDAASIAAPRRRRRAKSDGIDGETLLRTLLAWLRREPRVCSMVRPPSPEEEDRRRLVRERAALIDERNRETNRIDGLLAVQGITGYKPLRRDRRERLAELVTGDGRSLPPRLAAEIGRLLDRIELLVRQIAEVERERDRALEAAEARDPAAMLIRLRGIGSEGSTMLGYECFYRHFANRRQLGAFGGLAATPWRSGQIVREQGISKAGNPRLRTIMIELAWCWRRYQPNSALTQWWRKRVGTERGRVRRIAIVALARKLLVALWRYVSEGILPEGAELKAA